MSKQPEPLHPFSQIRSDDIQPFHVMAILAHAQALQESGVDVIHLEVGEPDFATPEPMIEAAVSALRAGKTGYTPALGLTALREKITDYYWQRFAVRLDPRRVVLTPGASGALLLLTAARLQRGQRMLLADPGYPCNRHFARLFEAHGQLIPTSAAQRFQLTPELVTQHWQPDTRVALVASPANPTGTVLDLAQLDGLANAVRAQQGEFWVDEIYQGLNYHNQPQTVLSVADDAIVINSFSKYFGMTGWRLGWCVVPLAWVATLEKLAQNLYLAPPTPAQHAAMAAFNTDALAIMEERRQQLSERRDYLLSALPLLGFTIPVAPDGAFYVYADASRLTDNSLLFCQQLLADTGVAITPGVDFGDHQGHCHVRFAFTTPLPRLQQAMARIEAWLASR